MCACVSSFCLYFADVFSSTMWSDLRAAVPQGSSVLQSLASSLPDDELASREPSTSSKYFFLTTDGGLWNENMA